MKFTKMYWNDRGWDKPLCQPEDYDKIKYLGECGIDGHLFAAYRKYEIKGNIIEIYKGEM